MEFRTLVSSSAALLVAVSVYRRFSALRAALRDATERKNRLALELMGTRNGRMHSEASVSAGRQFKPKPTDVFVVTYPKCGAFVWPNARHG